MISDNNKNLAQWAMDFALKNGCQAAKVNLYSGSDSKYSVRNAKIDQLQQASENQLTISLYIDNRYGTFSTNRLLKDELKKFILNGIDSTRYLAEDKFRVLPDASRYYKGGMPNLQLYDPEFGSLGPDKKVELALASAAEIYGKDERIISVESTFADGDSFNYMLTSNGFEGEKKRSWFNIYTSVSIKGEGEARPSAGWSESSLYFKDLITANVGQKALERALRKLGQKKVASGKYTMVVDRLNSARLLSPLLQALYGSALQQKSSFLLDKLDERIGSNRFTLRDAPHLMKSAGASYYDFEGVATQPRSIFDRGVLKSYFIDTYNAGKMGVEPTIGAPSLLTMELGKKDELGLIASVNKGIFVTGFNGGNCNGTTGDFSYGIEGFLIEKGKLGQAVSEMNITGNMIDLWTSLAEVGNDPRLTSSWRIPTLVFEGVSFSGL